MKRGLVLIAAAWLAGCADDTSQLASEDSPDSPAGVDTLRDQMPEDLPAGECRDTGDTDRDPCEAGQSSGAAGAAPAAGDAEAAPCQASQECMGTGACAAAYEDGQRGGFQCQFACIPTLDETVWCKDDASCCDADAICTPRGYCVITAPED